MESDRFPYRVEDIRIEPLVLTECQDRTMQKLERADPGARVIGWLEARQGPLVVRSNGDWQTVKPDGTYAVIARGHYS